MKHTSLFLTSILLAVGARAGAQTTQPSTTSGPTTDQMMNNMLSTPASQLGQPLPQAAPHGMVDATSGSGATAPNSKQVRTVREGSYIINRVGRLVRVPGGGDQMQIIFDADSSAMKDPPMLVLPNLKLMSMQGVQTGNSQDVRFRVSGLVTEFKNRNYILLDKAVVIPAIEQNF